MVPVQFCIIRKSGKDLIAHVILRITYVQRKMQVMMLSEFLRQNQVSLTEFAARIGTTTATVSRITDGIVVPRRKLLLRIFEETGGQVTPNDITGIHPPSCINNDKDSA